MVTLIVELESGKAAGNDTSFVVGEDGFSAILLKFWNQNWNQNWIEFHGQIASCQEAHVWKGRVLCGNCIFVLLPKEAWANRLLSLIIRDGIDSVTWCPQLTEGGKLAMCWKALRWQAYTKLEIWMAYFVNKYEVLG